MRALLAANALAAALVLVPIQARLEPLASAVESDANALAHAAVASSESPYDSALDIFSALSAWLSDLPDGNGAIEPMPSPPAGGGASQEAICAALDQSASRNDLPLDFFTRLIWQESRFNPRSISHAGAQGIAQFMPGTARSVGLLDPFDPIQALPKSAELLRELRTQFGNLGLAAAAYNAGPKRVEAWLARRKILPQETEAYVRIITGRSAQEWTSAEAADWGVAVPAPAPCSQLAKPGPHRPHPVIAARAPDRSHPILAAQRPERPATAAQAGVRRSPPHGVELAHSPSGVADRESIRCCRPPPHGVKLAHSPSDVADRESLRCCRLPSHDVKPAHSPSDVADRESIRCCRLPAHGVKLAHLESNTAAPKSIIAAEKSGHAGTHPTGSSPAKGAKAETVHAPRREPPPPSHHKASPHGRIA